jgi:multidrug efflux pump subunit AcrB
VSVPLSVIGVILALFLSGRAFGLTAFIGSAAACRYRGQERHFAD